MNVNLLLEDWEFIVKCLDYRLYEMDMEFRFYREEPPKEYYKLIRVRDSILSFTDSWNHVESKDHAG